MEGREPILGPDSGAPEQVIDLQRRDPGETRIEGLPDAIAKMDRRGANLDLFSAAGQQEVASRNARF